MPVNKFLSLLNRVVNLLSFRASSGRCVQRCHWRVELAMGLLVDNLSAAIRSYLTFVKFLVLINLPVGAVALALLYFSLRTVQLRPASRYTSWGELYNKFDFPGL